MAYQSEIEKLEARFREKPEQWFAALADAYRKAGDVDMALEVLGAWIDKRPTYTSGHIVRGRCLLDRERYDEAAGAFEQVLELDVENVIALKSLADIAERRGDTEAARNWLRRLLDVDPMSKEAQEGLERVGAGAAPAAASPPPPAGSPEAIAEPGLSFIDLDSAEAPAEAPAELTIERTEEAFDLSAMPPSGGERLDGLETSVPLDVAVPEAHGAVEGLEVSEALDASGAVELPEAAEVAEGLETGGAMGGERSIEFAEPAGAGKSAAPHEEPVAPQAQVEPVVSAEAPEHPAVPEPAAAAEPGAPPVVEVPARKRADGPSPSLELAAPASDWVIPEAPAPAPKPRSAAPEPVERKPVPPAVETVVPDLEPAGFAPPEDAEPVPIEDLAPLAFDAAFDEFAAQAGPLETAEGFEVVGDEEPDTLELPREPAPAREPRISTAEDVEFVQPPAAETPPPAAPAAEETLPQQPGTDPELPLILPEEVSADLDEPAIREPEPVVTETMAALYASQGLFAEAREIYVQLLERSPGSARLEGLLADIDAQAKAKAQPSAPRRERYSAGARGGASVGDLMRELAGTAPGPSPGAAPEPETSPEAMTTTEPTKAGTAGEGGFSFDEFFSEGAAPEQPPEAEADGRPEDEDFRDWLDGLKT